jgi:putative flippase GtrA
MQVFQQWLRHDAAALISTGVDFAVMVIAVETGHLGPVLATVVAAACGATCNFLLGRYFTYRVRERSAAGQVWRYGLVSAISLALNAAGEHLLHVVAGLQYLLARVITATVVATGWNYPLQRFFVFSAGGTATPRRPSGSPP